MYLKGVVALVTAGNGGLGQRICHALAQEAPIIEFARAADMSNKEPLLGSVA
jgi:3-oxoacyl-[acyl-carrier protein] reductase